MIIIGCDHGGFELKDTIKAHLADKGFEVCDSGTFSTDAVDYPDIAAEVCRKLTSGNADFAILICGTGIGISMAANKIKGIRAAVLHSLFTAQMAKEHNNTNVICFGGRTTSPADAVEMLDAYMSADFQGGRHSIRVDKIMKLEG